MFDKETFREFLEIVSHDIDWYAQWTNESIRLDEEFDL